MTHQHSSNQIPLVDKIMFLDNKRKKIVVWFGRLRILTAEYIFSWDQRLYSFHQKKNLVVCFHSFETLNWNMDHCRIYWRKKKYLLLADNDDNTLNFDPTCMSKNKILVRLTFSLLYIQKKDLVINQIETSSEIRFQKMDFKHILGRVHN